MVEQLVRNLLAAQHPRKGLLDHAAVLELAQHELVVARQQRAAGVAVVLGLVGRRAADGREEVVDQDGRLAGDGRGRLAVGEAGRVSEGEYIGVPGEGFWFSMKAKVLRNGASQV